ncbi:tetratricopeptide repeat protein [Teichococcus oryzae]|uniref:Tetratricopeptide repeat protein n=1 Tax=Teichococcus oryzae TaxID=1608942 RepID=A0A5B2TD17_9PROT|nr:tetratricopeptide repeat protein [Pseudoroseomonas oryzae]KAA2212406.1 tetratricopeptide repeat protein [Pseudoroseomonas oryzae]
MSAIPEFSRPEIIYEDDALQAVHQPGTAGTSLVTFGGLTDRPASGPDGPCFWGQKPAAQLGLNTVGVLAKAENWYPAEAMRRAAPAIRARLGPHSLGYGFSMGGYAALKHGRLLGLDAALAVSPQASIDPADIADDPRHHARFDPRRHGAMLVEPGDPPPFAVQIVDPHEPHDRLQAALIAARCAVATVPLPFLGHATIWHLADTALLGRLLECLRKRDAERLRQALRDHRAHSPHWARLMGRAAFQRGRPAQAERLWRHAVARGLPAGWLAPERAAALEARALRLGEQGRAAAALPFWLEAARILGHDAAAQLRIAAALRRQGQEEAALPLLRNAMALAPDDPATPLALADALDALNRPDEAVATLLGAAALMPDAEARLAARLWCLADRDEQEATLRRALGDAAHPVARGLAALQLGRLALRRGDVAGAARLAEQAVAWLPRSDQPLLLQWQAQEAGQIPQASGEAAPPPPASAPRPGGTGWLRRWLGGGPLSGG